MLDKTVNSKKVAKRPKILLTKLLVGCEVQALYVFILYSVSKNSTNLIEPFRVPSANP